MVMGLRMGLQSWRCVCEAGFSTASQSATLSLVGAQQGRFRLDEAVGEANWAAPAPTLDYCERGLGRVGIVRRPFTPSGHTPMRLTQLVKQVSLEAVVVDTEALHTRPVVDWYNAVGSRYVLEETSVCLLKSLKQLGVRVCLPKNYETIVKAGASVLARQSTNEVLMMAPTAFASNEQAAQDNFFMAGAQGAAVPSVDDLRSQVLHEYMGLYRVLKDHAGVKVNLMAHSDAHGTPDAVFPNNWFSTHQDATGGTTVLYPMKAPNRQAERRADIIAMLQHGKSYYSRHLSYAAAEESVDPKYLEGTGCFIFDHLGSVAYCMLSERSDESLAHAIAKELGFQQVVTFRSVDRQGRPIYHTNVVLAIGTSFAVICGESIADPAERKAVLAKLGELREVIDITYQQMENFAGNVLEVEDHRGLPTVAMSSAAHAAFTPEQRATLLEHCADIHHTPIPTLEAVGGVSVRCCIAELH